MASPSKKIAKLARPRLHRAIARERLFASLDRKRDRALVWLCGPPGSGKTTLVSTYLEAIGAPCIWYQLDGSDADLANFFYFFRIGASALSPKRKALPLFTPEYLADAAGFSRRFFRGFFNQAPAGVIVALDNYQDVAADSLLHVALAAAIEESPDGSSFLVMSRAEAPASFARARLNEALVGIDWDELRLTREEADTIVAARNHAQSALTVDLLRMTDGWVGGVTLLLERLRRDGVLVDSGPDATAGAAFDYFESQIMAPSTEEVCEVLMCASLLPSIAPALLCKLTGNSKTDGVLESLYHRHLFLDRRPGSTPTYNLHPLFQEFLLARAQRVLGARAVKRLRIEAAELLTGTDQHEAAVTLLLQAGHWERAEALLVNLAPMLIAQGRWQTLQGWIRLLPAARMHANPWLTYWLGRSQIALDATAAKTLLASAYEAFLLLADRPGQVMAAGAVLDALHYEFRDLSAMDLWVERVVQLLEQGVAFTSIEDELRVNAAVMIGASNRAPRHTLLDQCVRRVEALLEESIDPNLKVSVASMLHAYGNISGDARAEETAVRIARPLLNSPQLTAMTAALYLGMESHTHYVRSRFAEGLACVDRADKIAREHDLKTLMLMLGNWRGLNERRAGLLDQAEATVARTEALGLPPEGQSTAVLLQVKASVAFARGDYAHANAIIGDAYRLSDRVRFHTAMHIGLLLAYFGITAGDLDTPEPVLAKLHSRAVGPLAENYAGIVLLNQAWLEYRRGNTARCGMLLRDSLRRSTDPRQFFRYAWYGSALSELLPFALTQSIEPDIAVRLIRTYQVSPRDDVPLQWPWPVKVITLGRFEVLLDDAPLHFSRKAPRKTLALLKLVAAYGERAMPESQLLDALWPDEDGDAAHRALTATVHRLRTLLGDPTILRQRNGALCLNREKCWVDVYCFDALSKEGSFSAREKALTLYQGAFLPEDDWHWALSRREKLRVRYIELVARHGAELERAGDAESAARCYAKGLEADDLVESFYQGLMRCHQALGREDAARATFRRCRETLRGKLAQNPSSTTLQLAGTIAVP